MQKQNLSMVFKKVFWSNYDHFIFNIPVSLLWIVLHSPVFAVLFLIFKNDPFRIFLSVSLLNLLLLSPVTSALTAYTEIQLNPEMKRKKAGYLFKLIPSFFLPSLVLYVLDTGIILVLLSGLRFYLSGSLISSVVLKYTLTGITFWILCFFLLMHINYPSLLVRHKLKLIKIIYQSFLLVLAHPLSHLFFLVFLISSTIIAIFSILGVLFVFPAFLCMCINIFTLSSLSLYNPSVKIEEETRKWRNLIKPWE